MFLDCVKIVNFRRYYGNCHFNLDFTDEKNVTIFTADNNAGKSSLVNALSWCLYGEELHDSKDRSEDYCNVDVLEEAEQNENNPQVKVEVHIQFYELDDYGEKQYSKITRRLTFYKFGDGEWTSAPSDEVIFEDKFAKIYKDDYAEMKIEEIIPENMFKYFFFNGASMSNYFKYDEDDTFNLKDSIDNISQLDLIKRVSRQLDGTFTKLDQDRRNNSADDEDDIQDRINAEKEVLREEKSKKREYKEKYDTASRKVFEYEEKLKKVRATEVKGLMDKRGRCEEKWEEVNSKIKENTLKYENLILELFPLCALFEPLCESYNVVEKSIEKNAIPKNVRDQILKIIEDDGKCICGLDLKEHPECMDDVKNKLKTESVENSLYREEYDYIGNILKKLRKIPKIEELKSDINSDIGHLELIESKLDEISEKLLNSDEDKVNQFEESHQKYKGLKKKYFEKIEASSSRITNLNKKIDDLQKKADEIEYKNTQLLKIQSKIDFCNSLRDVMEDLKKGVRTQIRSKVNKKTKNHFISIKSDEYSDVSIDDQYGVHIVEKGGRTVIPADLSDGTENLLALSFIMALHSIKGIDFPLIIDAPFEKLDRKSRVYFVNGLHEFTKDKQVIFLFTDSQYTDEVRSHMLNIVLDEFKLVKISPKKTVIQHVL